MSSRVIKAVPAAQRAREFGFLPTVKNQSAILDCSVKDYSCPTPKNVDVRKVFWRDRLKARQSRNFTWPIVKQTAFTAVSIILVFFPLQQQQTAGVRKFRVRFSFFT